MKDPSPPLKRRLCLPQPAGRDDVDRSRNDKAYYKPPAANNDSVILKPVRQHGAEESSITTDQGRGAA